MSERGEGTPIKRERTKVVLLQEEKKEGKAMESHDLARLSMAKLILGALGILTLLALAAIIWAPSCRITQVMEFFSFIKSAVPPLVTLVAGFYFGQSSRND